MGGAADSLIKVGTLGLVETDFSGEQAGKQAANATQAAAKTAAAAQMAALDYLKQTEALPQQFRESALKLLGGGFGVEGGASADKFTRAIEGSPVYGALLGDEAQLTEDVLRSQSATGGLRTGATEAMIADQLQRNRSNAFMGALSGIQGLARIPSNATQIAQGMTDIGMTQAQGIQGAAQAQQIAQQQGFQNLVGLGQLGVSTLSVPGMFPAFCDPQLKSNAKKIAVIDGIQIYEWDWNEEAAKLGLTGKGYGPMADEIKKIWPDRVTERDGYMYVEAA
jgi:hypothetical protein